MNKPTLPKDVINILKKLTTLGHEAYIVGGCVRDSIMSRTPHDWDITTSALPLEVKACFDHTYDTGIKHGTVTVVLNGNNYEVTTFRIDGEYSDSRHPEEVSFTSNLTEDLLRRDFTMNAIAYSPFVDGIGYIDPFNGIEDINYKIIRGVGNPSKRFQEDALRMLRAIRFSSQLGFNVEEITKQALIENAALIENISPERIKIELEKLILSYNIENLPLLWETGLLKHISPQLNETLCTNGNVIVSQLKSSSKEIVLCWTILLQFIKHGGIKKILSSLRFDTKTLKTIVLLTDHIEDEIYDDEYYIRKTVFCMGIEEFKLYLKVKKIIGSENASLVENKFNTILSRNDCIFMADLNIKGEDIMAMGIERGKSIGIILNQLLDIVHKTPENNTIDILKIIVSENFI